MAYVRATGFVSLVLAIAFFLMEYYFWGFVVLVYLGLAIALVDSAQEMPLGRFRYFFIAIFSLALIGFTFGFVVGTTKPTIRSEWNVGNYSPGADVDGLTWEGNWSELWIFVANRNDADLNDVDVEFSIEEGVAAIKQTGGDHLCSLVDADRIEVWGTDASGHQMRIPGSSQKHPYRLLCPKIPAHVGLSIIAAVVDDVSSSEQKRKPEWVRFHAKYKARARPYNLNMQIVPTNR